MNSAQEWLVKNSVAVNSYLNSLQNEKRIGFVDKEIMWGDFMFSASEAKTAVEDFMRANEKKIDEIVDFLIESEVVIVGILAAQRMGKDCLACFLLGEIKKKLGNRVRIVTLGNFVRPPFVNPGDMYFSLTRCPVGTKTQRVYIYTSELDLFFPAREFKGAENTALAMQINTLAQNKQSIVGCAKLAANVDVAFWRACTAKIFKYMSAENLKHDRMEFLSELGMKLRPQNPKDKTKVMAVFIDKLVSFRHDAPAWYDSDMSNQFFNIDESMMEDYAVTLLGQGIKPEQIRRTFEQTYRFSRAVQWYQEISDKEGFMTPRTVKAL